jgi:hypothetical protein
MNKFNLDLPENGFGYPCNICANRSKPVAYCCDCSGYFSIVDFPMDKAELASKLEAPSAEGEGN